MTFAQKRRGLASLAILNMLTFQTAFAVNNDLPLTITFPFDKTNTYGSLALKGACQAGSTITVRENNQVLASNKPCTAGTYAVPVILNSGNRETNLKVQQMNGNVVQKTATVIVNKVTVCSLAGASQGALVTSIDPNNMPIKTNNDPGLKNPQPDGTTLFGYNGTYFQDINFPVTGYYKFKLQAKYYNSFTFPSANPYPKLQIAVDGRVVSESDVTGTSLTWYDSTAASSEVEAFQITAGKHRISLSAGNWSKEVGQSHYQNAFVKQLEIYRLTKSCAAISQTKDLSQETFLKLANGRGLKVGAVLDTGIAVNGQNLNVFTGDAKNLELLRTKFNHVTPGSVFLMDRIATAEGVMDFSKADAVVNWAVANNKTITFGHLVWHYFIPQWLVNKNNPAYTRQFLKTYIQTVMARYKGKVKYWVVVNEPMDDYEGMRNSFWHQQYQSLLGAGHGEDYIAEAFKTAQAADPSAVLLFNEYDADELGRKADATYNLVKTLLSQGVPIHAMGLQGHFKMNVPSFYKSTLLNMKRFAALGLKIHFSEVDVGLHDSAKPSALSLDMQAEYYRNTMRACVQTPACELYTIFGTLDKYWWGGTLSPPLYWGSIFDNNYAPKPAYNSLMKVLYGMDPL